MYSKINVKGKEITPLFKYLTKSVINMNRRIRWNFDGKFLIGPNGDVIQRWTNKDSLRSIDSFIANKLQSKL